MLKASQIPVSGNTARRSLAARLAILLFLGVFSFQLVRVFIFIEYCTHGRTSGYSLEHCKDYLGGLTPPVQLGGISPPLPQVTLAATWESLPSQTDPRLDPPLSSFFHPPRNLS